MKNLLKKAIPYLLAPVIAISPAACSFHKIAAGYAHATPVDFNRQPAVDFEQFSPGLHLHGKGYDHVGGIFEKDEENGNEGVKSKKEITPADINSSTEFSFNLFSGQKNTYEFGFTSGAGIYSDDEDLTLSLEGLIGLLRWGIREEPYDNDDMWTPEAGVGVQASYFFAQALAKAYIGREPKDGFGLQLNAGLIF